MDYFIYGVQTSKGTLLGMTSNPRIDLSYLGSVYGISSLDVFTPGLDITCAFHIMKEIDKNYSAIKRIVGRYSNVNGRLLLGIVRRAAFKWGIKCLRNPAVILRGCELPDKSEEDEIYQIIKGRLIRYSDIDNYIKSNYIFLNHNVSDILQLMYLKGRVSVFPGIIWDAHHKKAACICCNDTIKDEAGSGHVCCHGCGRTLYNDEPFFASPYMSGKASARKKLYRECTNMTLSQINASRQLYEFIEGNRSECLLWAVPGQEDIRIFVKSINKVLNMGGRILILLPCESEKKKIVKILSAVFMNFVFANDGGAPPSENGIDIALFKDSARFYRAYDLVILYEPPLCMRCSAENIRVLTKRALKPDGKLVIASSAPEYKTYFGRKDGDISLVAVPVRKEGMLYPEPRVLEYKGISEKSVFIPDEVMDFIRWSQVIGAGVRIIVPSPGTAAAVKEILEPYSLQNVWVDVYPFIIPHGRNKENVIVFFADKREVFNEKALLNALMVSGMDNAYPINSAGTPYEALFVGTHESEEMHNVKVMLRLFNKKAWEMGYIKQVDYDGKNT